MPRLRASAVGLFSARRSITETAMPAAPRSIARRIARTISPTSLRREPVHSYVAP